jgi:hypothetical protein
MAKDESKKEDTKKEDAKTTTPAAAAPAAPQGVNVQLVPAGQSDQPVLSNFTAVHPASGVAIVDFGFLDPGALAALSQLARSGKKIPERINGRLGARIALPYDSLATLHQQLGRLLQAVAKGRKAQ